jgi:hypothetical protein
MPKCINETKNQIILLYELRGETIKIKIMFYIYNMELAIPLLALGGMYVISNQPSQDSNKQMKKNTNVTQEKFTNMGKVRNYLPNTNIPPQNFPVTNLVQLSDTVQEYVNPNQATDKYFDQNVYEERVDNGLKVGQNPQEIFSLTGNYLDSNQFKHNNMVPFNGGKVKGNTYQMNSAEFLLDNLVGNGSQLKKKIEQAPLFKPKENMSWAHGAPNNSDFYQSRVNPVMKNNEVKLFDSVMVGPGLDKGYTMQGSGGFNSGMEARDKWLPYTVDQLRVETNPKVSYSLANHEGPAESVIKNVGIIGRVEKQNPDTFFINTQDRWLTTTGSEKGETLRPIQELGIIKRDDTVSDYKGIAAKGGRQVGQAPTSFEATKRIQLASNDINHSNAVGHGPITDGDINLRSHTNYSNNRSTVRQPDNIRSGFSGAIGAVVAPLLDFLKPTRKQETSANIRVYGEATSSVPSSYVINMNDITPTTIKETTVYSPTFYIDGQKEGMYVNNAMPGEMTQRDTTSCSYIGTSGGAALQYGDMSYVAAYKQHNNDIKSSTINNRANQGGTQMFNQQMNVNISKQDTSRYDGRFNPVSSTLATLPPSVQTLGAVAAPQYYNDNIGCERIQPDILKAFRENPYTHSLTTSV